MVKYTVAIRGGLTSAMRTGVETLINEGGWQDTVFILDFKTHSFELYGEEQDFEAFAKRFVGKFGLSYIRGETIQGYPVQAYVMFGKMQDGVLMSRSSDLAKKMF